MQSNTSLRIGLIYDPVMATGCALNPRCPYRGAGVDAALIVCTYLNLTCAFSWASDRNEYGREVNGTWTGMIGDISENRFDTSIPYFFPTYDRSRVVDFTTPYFVVDQVFVTRMPTQSRLPELDFTLIFAFDWPVWFCFILCCLSIGSLVSISEKIDPKYENFGLLKNRYQLLLSAQFEAFKYLSGNGDLYRPYQRIGVNLIFTWWGLFSIVLSGTYTGVMFCKRLTTPIDFPFTDMSTFVQCIETGKCRFIISQRQDYLLDRLTSAENEESQRLKRAFAVNKFEVVSQEIDLWSRIRNDTEIFWTTIDVKPFFYASTDYNAFCAYYAVEAPFGDMASFPISKNSSFRRRLDSAARIFRDDGFTAALTKKYQKSADQCQQISTPTGKEIVPLYSVRSYYIIYGIGIAVAIFSFYIEYRSVGGKRKRKHAWLVHSKKKRLLKFFSLKFITAKVE